MSQKRDVIVEVRVPLVMEDGIGRSGLGAGRDEERAGRYATALLGEIRANAGQFEDCRAVAVRFGGGQATALGEGLFTCLRELRKCLEVAPEATVSVNAGLSDFNAATATWFMRMRATRFDIEALSLDPIAFGALLPHDRLGVIPLIKEGYLQIPSHNRMGYVLAFGYELPGKANAETSLARCLRTAVASDAEHVTLVQLLKGACGTARPAPTNVAAAQLAQARTALLEGGLAEYLPLRFARPGREDPFFARDAKGAERIGFGAGAATLIDGVRSVNTANIELYCEKSCDFEAITASVEQVGQALG